MRRRGVDRLMPPNSVKAPASLFKLLVCLCGIYQSPPAATDAGKLKEKQKID